MQSKFISLCLFCWFCLFFITPIVQAEDPILTISKEKAIELALKNHGNIKLLEAKIKASESQKSYIETEKNELEKVEIPDFSALPTDVEFFIEQYPNFNELENEEKWAIEQLISTQILINTSLNQLLEGQQTANSQELQEKIKLQREELNKASIAAEIDKNKNAIDLDRSKEMIKYYISQKYVTLLLLQEEIEQLKKEQDYIEIDIQDLLVLKQYGLINDLEIERKMNELDEIHQKLYEKNKIQEFYLEELKLEIGIPSSQVIVLEKINVELHKLPIVELKNQIVKMFDVRIMEENIRLNREQYMKADSDKTELRDYYQNNLQASEYEKELLIKELNVKVKNLEMDQEAFFIQLEKLKKSKEELLVTQKDLEKQFNIGIITSKEKDKVIYDILRIDAQIDIYNYQYYLLKEKFDMALNGYLP